MSARIWVSGFVVAAIAVACSPVTPSISKFSNTTGGKTPTTDGSAPSAGAGTPAGSGLRVNNEASGLPAGQSTMIQSVFSGFARRWERIKAAKATLEFSDARTLSELVTTGRVEFSGTSEKLKGHESALAAGKARIHLLVDLDRAAIVKLRLDELNARVGWQAQAADGSDGRWEVAFERTGDPAADTDHERILKDLGAHLDGVFIEF